MLSHGSCPFLCLIPQVMAVNKAPPCGPQIIEELIVVRLCDMAMTYVQNPWMITFSLPEIMVNLCNSSTSVDNRKLNFVMSQQEQVKIKKIWWESTRFYHLIRFNQIWLESTRAYRYQQEFGIATKVDVSQRSWWVTTRVIQSVVGFYFDFTLDQIGRS